MAKKTATKKTVTTIALWNSETNTFESHPYDESIPSHRIAAAKFVSLLFGVLAGASGDEKGMMDGLSRGMPEAGKRAHKKIGKVITKMFSDSSDGRTNGTKQDENVSRANKSLAKAGYSVRIDPVQYEAVRNSENNHWLNVPSFLCNLFQDRNETKVEALDLGLLVAFTGESINDIRRDLENAGADVASA